MTDHSAIELLAYQRMAETGMTARELAEMDMSEYARATGRPTLGEIAARATDAPGTPRAPEAVQEPTTRPATPEPPGTDPNSEEFFLAWRAQRKSGGEGRGIFDSVGSSSAEFTAAVRNQAGRTAWSGSVTESPRVARAYVPEQQLPVYPSAQARFATPGNSYGA